MTWRQIEEIRADYFLATESARRRRCFDRANPSNDKRGTCRVASGAEWLRRLGTVDAQEGRVEEALAHYQVSLAAWDKESLGKPDAQMTLAPIKQYYLAHGGTEEKWPEWATAKMKAGEISNHRMPPTFALW